MDFAPLENCHTGGSSATDHKNDHIGEGVHADAAVRNAESG